MFYLFFQTWIWILAAGLLGLLVGWWIWGRRNPGASTAAEPAEVTRLERELAECRDRCRSLESAATDVGAAPVMSSSESARAEVEAEPDDAVEVSDHWRPEGLSEPRGGNADDLKRIRGIGPVIERTLNELGIYHFDQIAAFDDDNIHWVDNYIAFPGRIQRENWVSQAAELAGGGATEFSNRYDRGERKKT